MRTVHKYPVDFADQRDGSFMLRMPMEARVLSAGFQGDTLVIWASVETNKPLRKRYFVAVATGGTFPEIRFGQPEFIQTVFLDGLVFHVFELLTYLNDPGRPTTYDDFGDGEHAAT